MKPKINNINNTKIEVINIFPGIDTKFLQKLLRPQLKGIILKTYGQGNIMQSSILIKLLKKANNKGVVIINCSQCLASNINMNTYETGSHLINNGVLSGVDMTMEAIITKMFYLFSIGMSKNNVKKHIIKNISGEITTEKT